MQTFCDANSGHIYRIYIKEQRIFRSPIKQCPEGPEEQLGLASSAVPCAFSSS